MSQVGGGCLLLWLVVRGVAVLCGYTVVPVAARVEGVESCFEAERCCLYMASLCEPPHHLYHCVGERVTRPEPQRRVGARRWRYRMCR